jgi:threonylcarbamoyladenosine tRNA methylthiotransferase MtaB
MKSVGFITVGCKLNQFETEQMREAAQDLGYSTCGQRERADVYVINTCTVTSKSDYRSRQAVRRAIRLNPDATIIVTGCYAQLAPRSVAGMSGVDAVVGNAEKDAISKYLGVGKRRKPVVDVTSVGDLKQIRSRKPLHCFGRYTRAFVKIQDGCDNRCSYCAVPLARGGSRSKNTREVVSEIEVLAAEGFKEIVLTGVHLGSYGRDLTPPVSLAGLLRQIASLERPERVRLSSIEPTDFTGELIDLIADPAMKICPHVHVPLQSGDDRILKRMGRPYTGASYTDLISRIAERIPGCGIGADVMVGFPGEDAHAFGNTHDLLRNSPVTYLHVFSYSTRPGTTASHLEGHVPAEEKKVRSKVLRDLALRKSIQFREGLREKTLDVLVLSRRVNGFRTGLSGNYVRIFLSGHAVPNTMLRCRVSDLRDGGLLAEAV